MAGIKTSDAPLPNLQSNGNQVPHGGSNTAMDPKRLKRVAASREYSQRYRLKQMQYIAQLETGVKALEAQLAITYPRVQYVDTQNSLLRAENCSLKEKLYSLSTKIMMKEAEYNELRKKKDELKQLSLLYQSPIAETSRAKQHSFSQLLNIARDQAGFNQDLENRFGTDVNNGENRNPI
ncbi:hypothetical protein HRI_002559100 [Hibiscus trionum]|uniref:BZIP domain-containing protein n=1 Tax=Hibiscus trionum TaxID=183268 RepID=A0A9W7I6G3_HIBTR|nr:hypothetical protein HRI_002559100 [Hibiscus trionum]